EQQIRDQLAAVVEGGIAQRLVPRIGCEGRVPAVEVMIGTGLIRDCIREAKRTPDIPAAIAQGQVQYGMQTFDQCLLRLYREGLVSYETAREAASSPDDFDLKVRGIFSTGEQSFEQKTDEKPPDMAPRAGAAGASAFFRPSQRQSAWSTPRPRTPRPPVARRRLPALGRGDPVRVAVRLRDFLLRRGYSAAVVARVLRESTGHSVED